MMRAFTVISIFVCLIDVQIYAQDLQSAESGDEGEFYHKANDPQASQGYSAGESSYGHGGAINGGTNYGSSYSAGKTKSYGVSGYSGNNYESAKDYSGSGSNCVCSELGSTNVAENAYVGSILSSPRSYGGGSYRGFGHNQGHNTGFGGSHRGKGISHRGYGIPHRGHGILHRGYGISHRHSKTRFRSDDVVGSPYSGGYQSPRAIPACGNNLLIGCASQVVPCSSYGSSYCNLN